MKYAKFSDDFLSYFRLDDNGETLVLTDKRGFTRAVRLLPYEERPQGDLISRKTLKEDLASYDKEFAPDWVLNCIDSAPTVEVRDNKPKQGEWIFDGWGTYCSECGYRPKIGCGKFCSECGANMEGGVS